MRRLVFSLALVLILAPAGPADSQPKAGDPKEQVRQIVLRVAAATERGDLAALDAMYSSDPDLLIIEGGGADKGWRSYRDHHLAPELKELKELRYRYDAVRVDVAGDLAWSTFDYTLQAISGDKPLDIAGKGTLILKRSADGWKIIHSHTSGRPRKK